MLALTINAPNWIPTLTLIGLICFHILGWFSIAHVLMRGRTSQGTIAWIICMLVIPWVAVPSYWILGRQKFSGYTQRLPGSNTEIEQIIAKLNKEIHRYSTPDYSGFARAARVLGGLPFTSHNKLKLFIEGKEAFEAIFQEIDAAQDYILVNFFIVKNDKLGKHFKQALMKKAREGVRVYFLFDEIGSHKLKRSYLRELSNAGIEWHPFGANRHWWSRLQINFRNHRKIVVIDGKTAFVGGLNVGDEYIGPSKKFAYWRDTHVQLAGPSVKAVQLVFLEDWMWATNQHIELNWKHELCPENKAVAILPTGPADRADSWQLTVVEACAIATRRIWITSPYFVPDDGVLAALQAAAIRGVDVRILIPEDPDHLIVWLAAFTYYEQVLPFGVRLIRYQKGFLHQKVMLIDSEYAFVGSANLDNRSFRLNFEITAITSDPGFIEKIENMLLDDFENSRECTSEDLKERGKLFLVFARAARLFAPLL